MIKKLRKRFVRLSMVMIAIVLIVFYLFTMAVFFLGVTENVQKTLRNYSSESYFSQEVDLGVDNEENKSYMVDASSVCVVCVNEANTILVLDIGRGHIPQNVLEHVVGLVKDSDFDFGLLMKYNLFYYKTDVGYGYRIAFADSAHYYTYLRDMLYADGVIFLLALLVLYVIVRQLAKIFIKPVQRSWEQQQNFIADASHELKTPLTVILANCDILQSHPAESVSEQMKWIDSTNEEATHMKDMVNKMLFLAKNENTKPLSFAEAVNISELATRIVLQFEPVAYEAGVRLESEIEDGIKVTGDPTAINQIIHILVDNAVKYAGIGGVATLRLKRHKKTVLLSTQNTGEPIPPEDLPHIFERFYRSDKARTTGMGYGLGLAICKSLAEQQRAKIFVESNGKSGTVFTVRFPRRKRKEERKKRV